jgi:hypothetical protein
VLKAPLALLFATFPEVFHVFRRPEAFVGNHALRRGGPAAPRARRLASRPVVNFEGFRLLFVMFPIIRDPETQKV